VPNGSSTEVRALPPEVVPALLDWFARARRPLPWRRDRHPYRIWVAEVLLQQTRVAQAIPYYERFLDTFPTVSALAAAPLARVLKVWQGAGYYGRARHLHAAARRLVATSQGRLPRTVPELEGLPGVGPYIARAIAALAFDGRAVALEANGLRVAARWTREEGDVRRAPVRAHLAELLQHSLADAPSGAFTEALMELGETVCLPVRPRCEECPVAAACRARRELDDPGELPRRPPRRPRPHVRGAVVVLTAPDGRWFVQRRAPRGLLGGLWEFPGGKVEPGETPAAAAARELFEETGVRVPRVDPVGVVRHGYSHFTVELHVFRARGRPRRARGRRWVSARELARLPIPKATEKVVRLLATTAPDRASRGSGPRRGRTGASLPRARPRRSARPPARESRP
jgi:A/G-specific adenine glycosylase